MPFTKGNSGNPLGRLNYDRNVDNDIFVRTIT